MKLRFRIEFVISLACLIAPFGGGEPRAAAISTSEVGSVIKTYEPVEPVKAELKPLPELQLANFHYDSVGTHPNPYPYGQCTYGAASMKGNIPVWGNANNWDDAARDAGLIVSHTPIIGAVAQTDAGYWGHVAVVVGLVPGGVVITEMNYDYAGSVRTRVAPVGEFVYIYI